MPRDQTSVLIATLGRQPQIVTFALDALLAQGENIREVIVLYLAGEGDRINPALAKLSAEFADDYYGGHPCRLRAIPIRDGLNRLPDIRDEIDAEISRDMLQELIVGLKNERHHLHICISGGRRIIALLIMTVALFHFGYRDKLWHVYTPNEVQEQAEGGAMMHVRPEDGVHLIQVPLIPLGNRLSILQEQAYYSAQESLMRQINSLDREHRSRCEQVIARLSERELEALQAFAAGLTLQDVADKMVITPDTVNTYKKKILGLCRNAWPERKILNYFQLRELFGPYFEV